MAFACRHPGRDRDFCDLCLSQNATVFAAARAAIRVGDVARAAWILDHAILYLEASGIRADKLAASALATSRNVGIALLGDEA